MKSKRIGKRLNERKNETGAANERTKKQSTVRCQTHLERTNKETKANERTQTNARLKAQKIPFCCHNGSQCENNSKVQNRCYQKTTDLH